MSQWDDCEKMDAKVDQIVLWLSGVAFFITISCGMLFIPKIAKHVKGLKKLLILLQQLTLNLILLLYILYHSLSTESVYSYFISNFAEKDLVKESSLEAHDFDQRMASNAISVFVQNTYVHNIISFPFFKPRTFTL